MFDYFLTKFGFNQQHQDLSCFTGVAMLLLVYSSSGGSGGEYPVQRIFTSSGFLFSFLRQMSCLFLCFITRSPRVETRPMVGVALAYGEVSQAAGDGATVVARGLGI